MGIQRPAGIAQPPEHKLNGHGTPEGPAERALLSDEQAQILIESVQRASRVGLFLRTALLAVAIVPAMLATVYTAHRGDEMVDSILGRDRSADLYWEHVVALTLPVLLFVLLGGVCVIGAYVLQSRAVDECEHALDAVVGSYLIGVLFKVPSTVRGNLAALAQRRLIVTGYAREIGLLEADAYRAIAQARKSTSITDVSDEVIAAARHIRAATGAAVARIDTHCKTERG